MAIAIITGASRKIGIGAAIARALASDGIDCCLTYFHAYDAEMAWGSNPADVEELLAELRGMGVRAMGMNADLSDPTTPAQIFDVAESQLGKVSMLVNNAAYSVNADVEALTPELIDAHLAVNVRGMLLMCVEFVRRWAGDSGGRIINMSSGQSLAPMRGELSYVASKGAVEAITLTLSAEVASRGITVNAVDPGITDTGWIPDDLKAEFTQAAPMGRVGTPDDAARLIRFLASDDARWITGQVIRSRGGQ